MEALVTGSVLVRAVAFRRQALVAAVAAGAVIIVNAIEASFDREVVFGGLLLTLLCLAPVALAWSRRAYRIAAAVLAVLLTVPAVLATVVGQPALLPGSCGCLADRAAHSASVTTEDLVGGVTLRWGGSAHLHGA